MTTRSKTRSLAESFDFVFDTIFEQRPGSNLRMCCQAIGVDTLSDLLELTMEDMQNWTGKVTLPDQLLQMEISFGVLDIKKILHLQAWYAHFEDPDEKIWNTLSKSGYVAWYTQDQTKRVRASLGMSENVSQNPDVKPEVNPV